MEPDTFEHRGHTVEIPAQDDAKRMRLTIDDRTHVFGRDAAGAFFLYDFAYDRSEDLSLVIKNYLDRQEQEHNLSETADRRD